MDAFVVRRRHLRHMTPNRIAILKPDVQQSPALRDAGEAEADPVFQNAINHESAGWMDVARRLIIAQRHMALGVGEREVFTRRQKPGQGLHDGKKL